MTRNISFHDLGGCLRKREEQFVAAMRERWIVQRVRLQVLVFPDDLHGIGCGLTAQNLDAAGIIVEEGIQPAAQREQSQKILFEYRVRLVIVFPSIGQDPMLRLDNPRHEQQARQRNSPDPEKHRHGSCQSVHAHRGDPADNERADGRYDAS
jgi:hypothetical protein